ncbi:V-type proton ATPase subunit H-like [Uloborus diversus]|uniref:V-type proton ATPase subunit H-like n=1 Tax=Uloborus diversus TaxID=327109 RepID=UPI00240A70B2|nr:V-type proton ATPase subunit H-like [Uloborus diversus]
MLKQVGQFQHATERKGESSATYTRETEGKEQPGPSAKLEETIIDVTGYIEQKVEEIRAKSHVNWLPYYKAGLITQKDYSFITGFQHTRSREERDLLIDYFKEQGFQSFVVVVRRVCLVEEIQKFLVLIDDMLKEDLSRVDNFKPEETHPWRPFSDLLSCTDPFVSNMAGRIVAKLITGGKGRPERPDREFYMSWIKDGLRHDNRYLNSVSRCLSRMLRVDEYRRQFMAMNGVFRIVQLLSSGIRPQAQYMFCFNLWLASFSPSVTEKLSRWDS